MRDEKYGVGKLFKNNKDEEFEIVEKLTNGNRKIRFISTGYEFIVNIATIIGRKISNTSQYIMELGKLYNGKEVKEIIINGVNYDRKDVKRFLYTENENGCWECFSHSDKGGNNKDYIAVRAYGRSSYLHRESYRTYNGEIPKGMVIMHTCDNTKCCNPNHLKLGTHKDNVDDKVSKNRQLKGSDVGNSVLKEEDVLKIIDMCNRGIFEKDVAKIFNVNRVTIHAIKSGKIWSYTTGIIYDKNKWKRAEFQSGEVGVKWKKRENKWEVIIKGKYVGRYVDLEEAIKAKYEYINNNPPKN